MILYYFICIASTLRAVKAQGSNPDRNKRYLCAPKFLDRIWRPSILLFNENLGSSQGREAAGACI